MAGILTTDMQQLVRQQRLGFVATVSPDGSPNLSPKGTTTVWDDDHLVFADIRSPGTVANLRDNPRVEINVVDPIRRRGYRFAGAATILDSGPRFEEALAFFEAHDEPLTDARARIRSIVIVAVERALPLTSPAYDLGLSEEQVVERWLAYFDSLWASARGPSVAVREGESKAASGGS
jgi:predicted pyridoxine 5'-phosphate oxidase superfamily flavin-nucleotide-binding protein